MAPYDDGRCRTQIEGELVHVDKAVELSTSDSATATGNDALSILTVERDNIAILTVHGSLDLLTATHLATAVGDALESQPHGVIIDLTATEFLASAGMTALVAAYEATTPAPFGVVAAGPSTARPLKLVGLDHTFALYPTLDEALAATAAASPNP